MKSLTLLLIFTAFAVAQPGQAQEVAAPTTLLHPPSTPTPAPAKAGPAKPLEAVLSMDEKGKQPATAFPASAPKIYLHFTDDGATKGEQLRVVWVAEEVKYYKGRNKKVTEFTQTLPGPGANGTFFLPPPNGLATIPAGKYRADIYLAGKLAKSLKFAVGK